LRRSDEIFVSESTKAHTEGNKNLYARQRFVMKVLKSKCMK